MVYARRNAVEKHYKKFGLSYRKFIFEQFGPVGFLIGIFNRSAELFIVFFNSVFPSINHIRRAINPIIKWFML